MGQEKFLTLGHRSLFLLSSESFCRSWRENFEQSEMLAFVTVLRWEKIIQPEKLNILRLEPLFLKLIFDKVQFTRPRECRNLVWFDTCVTKLDWGNCHMNTISVGTLGWPLDKSKGVEIYWCFVSEFGWQKQLGSSLYTGCGKSTVI